jgi:hypothetical protein
MKKFLLKSLLFALPVILLMVSFVVLDPFRLFKEYEDYSKNLFVNLNRDVVSTEVYLKNKDKYHYNSFIFGSSRTLAYKTEAWRNQLEPGASPFVFDASGESIFGIWSKVKFIDRQGGQLDNCLIILCTDASFKYESDHHDHLGIKHPSVAGTSWINFYWVFFKAYLDRPFFKSYLKYLRTRKYDASMKGYIEPRDIKYNTVTNDAWIVDQEREWQDNQPAYYAKRQSLFYDRPVVEKVSKAQISPLQASMLKDIRQIFKKHGTSYKWVISPLYDQVRFNGTDLQLLKELFEGQVFDFSGKNAFTEDKSHYYENSHYRPAIGEEIMRRIYLE